MLLLAGSLEIIDFGVLLLVIVVDYGFHILVLRVPFS